jgi:membrane protease YdiL (CAAX protease family)
LDSIPVSTKTTEGTVATDPDIDRLPSGRTLLGLLLLYYAVNAFFRYLFDTYLPDVDIDYLFLVGAAQVAIVIFVTLAFCPDVFKASRWRLSRTDVAIALTTTVCARVLSLFLVGYATNSSFHPVATIPLVFLAPMAEECLFRGIFVRSLVARFPTTTNKVAATLGVALMAADFHPLFWNALLIHSLFSIVYLLRKNSLTSSILCHALFNILVVA